MVLVQRMIDLKLPSKTIYADILNMPDPMQLGICARIFNLDDIGLYMQLEGSHPNWTFTPVNLGSWASGTSKDIPRRAFGSRAKPAVETVEVIAITLNAYTDGGYSNLKWTMTRNITVFIVDSIDASWSLDEDDNFDDGTVQGWAASSSTPPVGGFGVANDYFLSPPWSLKATEGGTYWFWDEWFYKSFNTADKDHVLAIADVRFEQRLGLQYYFSFQILIDGVVTVYPLPTEKYWERTFRLGFWYRFVFPLPRNSTVEIRLKYFGNSNAHPWYLDMWLDDFRIISKD